MTDVLLLAFIFLVAGVISVPIASKLGLGSVLGYLVAGILIGPFLVLLEVDVVSIQHFAEFGVVMMLFLVGLELEPKLLWSMRLRLLGLGGGQVLLTTAAIMAVAMVLGQPWTVSLAIGLVFALSSTAIALQSLNEKGLMKCDGGQSAFSVLLFQDISVIPMLALLPLLALPVMHSVGDTAISTGAAAHGEVADPSGGLSLVEGLASWQIALVTLGAVAAVVLVGGYLTRPILRFVASARLREMFTATALMMVIGIALLMSLVGLSPALGTFLAGVVLANSEYRHELESNIAPFKGLLLGLFFMTVGASINFSLLLEDFGIILGMTVGLMALKAFVLLTLGTVFKLRWADRWLLALSLAQAGEFGFVLLSLTVANAVIPAALAAKMLLVVALSMLLTPLLFVLYDRVVAPRFVRDQDRVADEIPEGSPVIIAGHGRIGALIGRILSAAGFRTTAIDFSSKQLEMLQRFGIRAYFGDATRPDLLHAAGIAEARLLIVAIDRREQINELVEYALRNYPDLHVMARAVDRDHVYELYGLGCRDIIRETYDSTIRMGRSALEALGATRDQADRMSTAFDTMDRRSMIELAQHYDTTIPTAENELYIAKTRELLRVREQELGVQMCAILKDDVARP